MSEKRQRTALVGVRLLPDEYERLCDAASARGQTPSTYLRVAAFARIGAPAEPAPPPPLCQWMSAFGDCHLSLGHRGSHATNVGGDVWFAWDRSRKPVGYMTLNDLLAATTVGAS